MSVSNCCSEPICYEPWLLSSYVAASLTKCGSGNGVPSSTAVAHYYLSVVQSTVYAGTITGTSSQDYNFPYQDPPLSYTFTCTTSEILSGTLSYTTTTDISNPASCVTTGPVCTGSVNTETTASCTGDPGGGCVAYDFNTGTDCSGATSSGTVDDGVTDYCDSKIAVPTGDVTTTTDAPPTDGGGTYTTTETITTVANPDGNGSGTNPVDSNGNINGPGNWSTTATGSFTQTISTTYSNEYTTDTLKTNTVSLPSYSAWSDYVNTGYQTTSSIMSLSEDESNYSIQKIKWKIQHNPTATCYLKAWPRSRFIPEGSTFGDSTNVLTDLAAYEWIGSGDPYCMADPTIGYSQPANQITGAENDQDIPTSNGEKYVEIKKWTCVKDYVPDDPLIDNTRPTPDVNPNGYPAPFPIVT